MTQVVAESFLATTVASVCLTAHTYSDGSSVGKGAASQVITGFQPK